MQLAKKCGVLLASLALTAPLMVRAEEAAAEAVSASLDLPVLSGYVWRGQVINDEPVFQPTFTVAKGGLSINWWGGMNLTDEITGDEFEFSEHDITISYNKLTCPLTDAAITIGIVHFDFPNIGLVNAEGQVSLVKDTHEAFLTYSLGNLPLTPTATINYDFKEADGFYGNLGISHALSVAEKLTLNLAASIGGADSDWSSYYYGDIGSGLTDYSVSANLPVTLCNNWTLTPGVQYVGLLDDAKDVVDDTGIYYGDTDKVVGSIKLSYVF